MKTASHEAYIWQLVQDKMAEPKEEARGYAEPPS